MLQLCKKCFSSNNEGSKQPTKSARSKKYFRTDLMKAAKLGHVKCVKAWIKVGADINARDENFSTALMRAADRGRTECVKLLIQAGADVNLWNGSGHTALTAAAHAGSVGSVKVLLDAGAAVDIHKRVFKASGSPLAHAVAIGEPAIVDILIQAGADVNEHGNKADVLSVTSHNQGLPEYTECVRLLLKAGADVNKQDKLYRTYPIIEVAHDDTRVKLMIEAGANVNLRGPEGYTALMHAAAAGSYRSVKLLLEAGADVNACGSLGTALMYATGSTRFLENRFYMPEEEKNINPATLKCALLLLEAGSDVDRASSCGRTPLMMAAFVANAKCVEVLIRNGADVNATSPRHFPMLLGAVLALMALRKAQSFEDKVKICKDVLKCIQLLLRAGVKINVKGKLGGGSAPLSISNVFPAFGENSGEDFWDFFFHGIFHLLVAAGEKFEIPSGPGEAKEENRKIFSLKEITRKAIRKHLLDLKPHENLFNRVPQLELPSELKSYLLYDTSLETKSEVTGEEEKGTEPDRTAVIFTQAGGATWEGPNHFDDTDDDESEDEDLDLSAIPPGYLPPMGPSELKKFIKSNKVHVRKACDFNRFGPRSFGDCGFNDVDGEGSKSDLQKSNGGDTNTASGTNMKKKKSKKRRKGQKAGNKDEKANNLSGDGASHNDPEDKSADDKQNFDNNNTGVNHDASDLKTATEEHRNSIITSNDNKRKKNQRRRRKGKKAENKKDTMHNNHNNNGDAAQHEDGESEANEQDA